MIPWRERFDMVVSLCHTGNRSRVPSLDRELRRVGLTPDLRVWSVPDPSEAWLERRIRLDRFVRRAGYLNCTLNHYRAIRTAYDLGKRRVLLLEDDVRFLKDLDALAETVANTPDVPVVQFDLISDGAPSPTPAEIRGMAEGSATGRWAVPQPHPCSMACTGLDREGMAHFLRCLDDAFAGRRCLEIIDGYLHPNHRGNLPVRVAWPLACIQVPVADSPSNTAQGFFGGDTGCQLSWYRSIGVDPKDYGGGDGALA